MAEKLEIEFDDKPATDEEKSVIDKNKKQLEDMEEEEAEEEAEADEEAEDKKNKSDDKEELTVGLGDMAATVWSLLAVPKGYEAINANEQEALQKSYSRIEEKYKIRASPELDALFTSVVVFAPKVAKYRASHKKKKPQEVHDAEFAENTNDEVVE